MSENKTYGFGIFGCGVIANTHAKVIGEIENATLCGCADISLPYAEKFAEKHETVAFSSLDEMLENDDIDVINVCTPSGTHADIAIKILEADKNVILEKPMAITTADCDRIIEAAKKSKGNLMVISQMRTAPDIKHLKSLIDSDVLGKILLVQLNMNYYRDEEYFKGSWRGSKKMDGGGALMNQGIHGVDLIGYLVGKVAKVSSIVRTLAHNIEVEDMAVANLEFENGALGIITASTAVPPGFDRETKIFGTNGYAHLIETKIVELIIDGENVPCEKFISSGAATSNQLLDNAGHKRQIEDFIDIINGIEREYIDENEGKIPVELVEKIYESSI